MKQKITILMAIFLFFGNPHQSIAQERERGYQAPWGMAGCGVWGSVLSGKDQGSQLGVWALRNFIMYDSQTSAISSGTSNCVQPRLAMHEEEQEVFIAVNLGSLELEAAQGHGEHLWSLSEIFGCPDHQAFAKLSQSRYTAIFDTREPDLVLQNYLREVHADQQLNGQCLRAS